MSVSKELSNKDTKLKFVLDLKKRSDAEVASLTSLLKTLNAKDKGGVITATDIILYFSSRASTRDIKRLQEASLSPWDKIEGSLASFNKTKNLNLTLEEYLSKKLKIQ